MWELFTSSQARLYGKISYRCVSWTVVRPCSGLSSQAVEIRVSMLPGRVVQHASGVSHTGKHSMQTSCGGGPVFK